MPGTVRNPAGPLINAGLIQINEAVFWDKTRPLVIDPQDTDREELLRDQDRADLLAFRRIGNVAQDWIILERNDYASDGDDPNKVPRPMRLWPNDFVPGRKIKIPTVESLQERGLYSE